MPEGKPALTLYVESRKAVTSFYRPPRGEVTGTRSAETAEGVESAEAAEAAYFLSDDQARVVALVEELAARRGYSVEVKDVAKVGRLGRLVSEHLRNVTQFPVLLDASGHRLEGSVQFTEDRICELMPAEMQHQRAFTYVKVRGGDLEILRRSLLDFPEVREVHFLTGDWDAFVVLEFSRDLASKRRILDFVTQRIRSHGNVLDTSTLVPEYSVTKFPL